MRALLSTVALLISISSAANAGPKEEAFQVVEKWTKAFSESDVDGIVKLYAADAVMLGTGSKALITSPEGIRKYFEGALRNSKLTAALGERSVLQISDTTVVVTGSRHDHRHLRGQTAKSGGTRYVRHCQTRRGLADRSLPSVSHAELNGDRSSKVQLLPDWPTAGSLGIPC